MPLVSIKQELIRAQAGHFALPLFDAWDMPSIDGMLQAAEEKRCGLMLGMYAGAVERPNGPALVAYAKARAQDFTVPVSVMLDHGGSVEQCVRVLKMGFNDVMLDASKLPLEENIANTRAVVQIAHAFGAAVEAELGHVGVGSTYDEFGAQREGFTNPDDVERFVEETGVDFLAIAIGTAHGLYKGNREPELDLELLSEIRSRVDTPLVLHGGSGSTEAQFREVIQRGITKVNISTDLVVRAGKAVQQAAIDGESRYFNFDKIAEEVYRERCGYYLDLFGATGTVE